MKGIYQGRGSRPTAPFDGLRLETFGMNGMVRERGGALAFTRIPVLWCSGPPFLPHICLVYRSHPGNAVLGAPVSRPHIRQA